MPLKKTEDLLRLKKILVRNNLIRSNEADYRVAFLSECNLDNYAGQMKLEAPTIIFVADFATRLKSNPPDLEEFLNAFSALYSDDLDENEKAFLNSLLAPSPALSSEPPEPEIRDIGDIAIERKDIFLLNFRDTVDMFKKPFARKPGGVFGFSMKSVPQWVTEQVVLERLLYVYRNFIRFGSETAVYKYDLRLQDMGAEPERLLEKIEGKIGFSILEYLCGPKCPDLVLCVWNPQLPSKDFEQSVAAFWEYYAARFDKFLGDRPFLFFWFNEKGDAAGKGLPGLEVLPNPEVIPLADVSQHLECLCSMKRIDPAWGNAVYDEIEARGCEIDNIRCCHIESVYGTLYRYMGK